MSTVVGRCDICWTLRRDGAKKTVTWCRPCKRWKCEVCNNSPIRSGAAMVKEIITGR